ncbi:lipase [Sesbania bispinosa]|nr:lipase [Sesbania bispinosa]
MVNNDVGGDWRVAVVGLVATVMAVAVTRLVLTMSGSNVGNGQWEEDVATSSVTRVYIQVAATVMDVAVEMVLVYYYQTEVAGVVPLHACKLKSVAYLSLLLGIGTLRV